MADDKIRDAWLGLVQEQLELAAQHAPDEICRRFAMKLLVLTTEFDEIEVATLTGMTPAGEA